LLRFRRSEIEALIAGRSADTDTAEPNRGAAARAGSRARR
jgi:hypothetical protein